MKTNRGKNFEDVIKHELLRVNDAVGRKVVDVQRLYDTTNGFSGIKQPSDFSVYLFPHQFYLECKSTNAHTLNQSYITQLVELEKKAKVEGVQAGVFIWFVQDDLTVYVPIQTLTNHFYNRNKKSVSVKEILNEDLKQSGWYYILKGKKKRVFFEYDMLDFFKSFCDVEGEK